MHKYSFIIDSKADRDTFFFLSEDYDDTPLPIAFNKDFSLAEYEDYAVGGLVFTSYYENGVINLGCTNITEEKTDTSALLTLSKLNGRVWESTDFSAEESFSADCFSTVKKQLAADLDKGVYRISAKTDSGYAYTEFEVK